ncbi:MAG TPA: WGR domain-containing protein [Gemmataceae bacterium]|jgi:uncharacterized protein (TIGR02996 family)|nr:WGR domain-containing protein [Gemmataceae bacterium]
MRTFTYSDAKSHKFWNVELQGSSLTVTYGRIGSAGQTQTKAFKDAAAAQKEHDKLVKEKLAKGYVESAPAAVPSPTRLALEQALVEDPDDLAAHSAYADYLAEQGDPRGEFVQVQLALEAPDTSPQKRKDLQAREQALLKEHGREWLGSLAEHLLGQKGSYRPQFARGWLDGLQIAGLSVRFARALAKAPQARLLRQLVIEGTINPEEGEDAPDGDVANDIPEGVDEIEAPLCPLIKSANLRNVRVFQLGQQVEELDSTFVGAHGVGVPLVKTMPRLEELYLLAHMSGDDLTALFGLKSLRHLRVLQVYHVEHGYPLAVLARNASLGRLTRLWLRPHGLGCNVPPSGAYIDLDGVRAVLRSPHLKALTHLRVQLCNMGDRGCEEIVRSGALKRLRVLELSYGEITDEGACVLAACPDLRNLELLDLSHNGLTEAGRAALAAVPIQVRADDQFRAGEDGYLMYGDME